MGNPTDWIVHLKHPLVLVGFALFILSSLLRTFFSGRKLSNAATERLMRRGMNYVFVLALIIIFAGFVISLKTTAFDSSTISEKTSPNIQQQTRGTQSPAIVSGQDVIVTYGGTQTSPKKDEPVSTIPTQPPSSVTQQTHGDQSPAINSGGDVNLNYGK